MAFGSFREVAVLEEPIEATNETGEFIQTWVCFAKVRASIVSHVCQPTDDHGSGSSYHGHVSL